MEEQEKAEEVRKAIEMVVGYNRELGSVRRNMEDWYHEDLRLKEERIRKKEEEEEEGGESSSES